jgi:hypothetical protein
MRPLPRQLAFPAACQYPAEHIPAFSDKEHHGSQP